MKVCLIFFVRDEKVLDIVKTVLAIKHTPFSDIVFPRNAFGIGNSSKFLSNSTKDVRVFGRFNGKRDYRYTESDKIFKE